MIPLSDLLLFTMAALAVQRYIMEGVLAGMTAKLATEQSPVA